MTTPLSTTTSSTTTPIPIRTNQASTVILHDIPNQRPKHYQHNHNLSSNLIKPLPIPVCFTIIRLTTVILLSHVVLIGANVGPLPRSSSLPRPLVTSSSSSFSSRKNKGGRRTSLGLRLGSSRTGGRGVSWGDSGGCGYGLEIVSSTRSKERRMIVNNRRGIRGNRRKRRILDVGSVATNTAKTGFGRWDDYYVGEETSIIAFLRGGDLAPHNHHHPEDGTDNDDHGEDDDDDDDDDDTDGGEQKDGNERKPYSAFFKPVSRILQMKEELWDTDPKLVSSSSSSSSSRASNTKPKPLDENRALAYIGTVKRSGSSSSSSSSGGTEQPPPTVTSTASSSSSVTRLSSSSYSDDLPPSRRSASTTTATSKNPQTTPPQRLPNNNNETPMCQTTTTSPFQNDDSDYGNEYEYDYDYDYDNEDVGDMEDSLGNRAVEGLHANNNDDSGNEIDVGNEGSGVLLQGMDVAEQQHHQVKDENMVGSVEDVVVNDDGNANSNGDDVDSGVGQEQTNVVTEDDKQEHATNTDTTNNGEEEEGYRDGEEVVVGKANTLMGASSVVSHGYPQPLTSSSSLGHQGFTDEGGVSTSSRRFLVTDPTDETQEEEEEEEEEVESMTNTVDEEEEKEEDDEEEEVEEEEEEEDNDNNIKIPLPDLSLPNRFGTTITNNEEYSSSFDLHRASVATSSRRLVADPTIEEEDEMEMETEEDERDDVTFVSTDYDPNQHEQNEGSTATDSSSVMNEDHSVASMYVTERPVSTVHQESLAKADPNRSLRSKTVRKEEEEPTLSSEYDDEEEEEEEEEETQTQTQTQIQTSLGTKEEEALLANDETRRYEPVLPVEKKDEILLRRGEEEQRQQQVTKQELTPKDEKEELLVSSNVLPQTPSSAVTEEEKGMELEDVAEESKTEEIIEEKGEKTKSEYVSSGWWPAIDAVTSLGLSTTGYEAFRLSSNLRSIRKATARATGLHGLISGKPCPPNAVPAITDGTKATTHNTVEEEKVVEEEETVGEEDLGDIRTRLVAIERARRLVKHEGSAAEKHTASTWKRPFERIATRRRRKVALAIARQDAVAAAAEKDLITVKDIRTPTAVTKATAKAMAGNIDNGSSSSPGRLTEESTAKELSKSIDESAAEELKRRQRVRDIDRLMQEGQKRILALQIEKDDLQRRPNPLFHYEKPKPKPKLKPKPKQKHKSKSKSKSKADKEDEGEKKNEDEEEEKEKEKEKEEEEKEEEKQPIVRKFNFPPEDLVEEYINNLVASGRLQKLNHTSLWYGMDYDWDEEEDEIDVDYNGNENGNLNAGMSVKRGGGNWLLRQTLGEKIGVTAEDAAYKGVCSSLMSILAQSLSALHGVNVMTHSDIRLFVESSAAAADVPDVSKKEGLTAAIGELFRKGSLAKKKEEKEREVEQVRNGVGMDKDADAAFIQRDAVVETLISHCQISAPLLKLFPIAFQRALLGNIITLVTAITSDFCEGIRFEILGHQLTCSFQPITEADTIRNIGTGVFRSDDRRRANPEDFETAVRATAKDICKSLSFLDKWHERMMGGDLLKAQIGNLIARVVLTLVDEVLVSARMDLWSVQAKGPCIVGCLEYRTEPPMDEGTS